MTSALFAEVTRKYRSQKFVNERTNKGTDKRTGRISYASESKTQKKHFYFFK